LKEIVEKKCKGRIITIIRKATENKKVKQCYGAGSIFDTAPVPALARGMPNCAALATYQWPIYSTKFKNFTF
jgi:hypothetical protein